MKRIFISFFLPLLFIGSALADEVTFVASAPRTVVVDNHFKLQYTVNTTDVNEPVLADLKGFELLSGPARSTSFSSRTYNGKTTSSNTVTFTYILLPKQTGEYTIPGATITVSGKKMTSNSVTVNVLKSDSKQNDKSNSLSIGDDEIFIEATVSRSKVYMDEGLLITYKLYTSHDIAAIQNSKMPQFDNFFSTSISSPSNVQFDIEYYKGREYYSAVLSKYLLQPQKSGKLKIEPMVMDVVVSKTVYNQDPFSIFGGFPETIRMNKSLKSNAVEISVEALPNGAPTSFSGAVGQYSLTSQLSDNELYTNKEATLKVVLEGTGNMNFIEAPSIDLPVEFDSYPPVKTDEYKLQKDSYVGKKVYEYVITPKNSGSYTIPPMQFTFFNTKTKKYETVATDSIRVNVQRAVSTSSPHASGQHVNKVRGEVLAKDIRHIKTDNDGDAEVGTYFFASMEYFYCYVLSLLVLLFFMLLYRKNLKENSNVLLVRTKKANKAAVKRLKVAKKFMQQGKSHEFYDESLKAIWGYFSDKLSIPLSELTKDNVQEALYARGVSEQLVGNLMKLFDECEFAHYAPGDATNKMDGIYKESISVISDMEKSIK